jgi:hypothetical protein
MTPNFQDGLKKLKQKNESHPAHIISQTQTLPFQIYTFDLNSEIDPNQIVDLCKSYQQEEFRDKDQVVYAWNSIYIRPNNNKIVGFEDLLNAVKNRVKPIWTFPYTYLVSHYWFIVYNKNDHAVVHNHRMVDLACVYYAAVPEGSSPLVIPTVQGDLTIVPKPGMLVVMPGMCEHFVPNSDHDEERIIVAINIAKDKLLIGSQ